MISSIIFRRELPALNADEHRSTFRSENWLHHKPQEFGGYKALAIIRKSSHREWHLETIQILYFWDILCFEVEGCLQQHLSPLAKILPVYKLLFWLFAIRWVNTISL